MEKVLKPAAKADRKGSHETKTDCEELLLKGSPRGKFNIKPRDPPRRRDVAPAVIDAAAAAAAISCMFPPLLRTLTNLPHRFSHI